MQPRVTPVAILISACFVLATAAFAGPQKPGAKTSDAQLRRKNQADDREVLDFYPSSKASIFLPRMAGTTPHALCGASSDRRRRGREKQREAGRAEREKQRCWKTPSLTPRAFPDWKYSTLKVYSTQDPNVLFVEAAGSGTFSEMGTPRRLPDNIPIPYSRRSHYAGRKNKIARRIRRSTIEFIDGLGTAYLPGS